MTPTHSQTHSPLFPTLLSPSPSLPARPIPHTHPPLHPSFKPVADCIPYMNRLEVLNLTGCLIGSIGAMHLFLALEDALEKSHAATGATRLGSKRLIPGLRRLQPAGCPPPPPAGTVPRRPSRIARAAAAPPPARGAAARAARTAWTPLFRTPWTLLGSPCKHQINFD